MGKKKQLRSSQRVRAHLGGCNASGLVAWNVMQHAIAAYRRGSLFKAQRLCRTVLAASPGHFDALQLAGVIATQMGRPKEAAQLFAAAVAIRPNKTEAHNNYGNALCDLVDHAGALASYDRALAIDPVFAAAHFNRGNVLFELRRYAEALASYDVALTLAPSCADALNNRGNVLRNLKRYAEAEQSLSQAIALQPDSADAYSNRGHVRRDLKRYADAIADYQCAIELRPAYASAHFDLALCRLLLGEFVQGWDGYEWRWRKERHASLIRNCTQPLWDGTERLEGKTILLYSEQGLGDTIQFCRYATLVAALGATVLLEVPPPLVTLLAKLEGCAQVLAAGTALPAFDYHCPLMSLPHLLKTELQTIPADIPYLKADAARVTRWRESLGPTHRYRVGLVWSANVSSGTESCPRRSAPLVEMLPLVGDWAQFVCLQKDVLGVDAPLLASNPDILCVGQQLDSFADTAALIELMDVVVTVDTSVAHVAGALGRPVWVILEYSADWRWLLDRDDSPWYPTARLFRQTVPGDWAGVIARICDELRKRYGRRDSLP